MAAEGVPSCFGGLKPSFRGKCGDRRRFTWMCRFVAAALFCEPQGADFVAGASVCERYRFCSRCSMQRSVNLAVQILWQAECLACAAVRTLATAKSRKSRSEAHTLLSCVL